jgi:predicted PP-loop superfamily ATPase
LHVEEAMANVTKGLHLQLTVTTDCVLRVTTARVLRETRSKVVQVDITNKF